MSFSFVIRIIPKKIKTKIVYINLICGNYYYIKPCVKVVGYIGEPDY